AIGDKMEDGAALHLDRPPRMVREHERRNVIRRLLAPPSLPALVGPGAADWAEHVPPQDPRADAGEGHLGHPIVDAGLAAALAVPLSPGARVEEPLHQLLAPDTQRMLEALVRPGAESIERYAKAHHANFRHGSSFRGATTDPHIIVEPR